MDKAQAFVQAMPADHTALDKLRAVVAWTMRLKLAGANAHPAQPELHPAHRPDAPQGLYGWPDGRERRLGEWIEEAQAQGAGQPSATRHGAVLYTLFARACDPVLEFLKATDLYSEDDAERAVIVDMVMEHLF
jgi:TetR/AcrR family transcriptional regulator of autoinduction and epiphytic fitness